MKRLLCFLTVVFVATGSAYAQERKNSIFFEGFGTGVLASVHYERMITRNVGLSTGIGYVFSDSDDGFSVPILLKYLKGEGSGKMELGVGATYVRLGDDADDDIFDVYESQWMGSLYIGYRYEADNGFLYRAGFSPFFNEEGFHPYTGFSVGCSF